MPGRAQIPAGCRSAASPSSTCPTATCNMRSPGMGWRPGWPACSASGCGAGVRATRPSRGLDRAGCQTSFRDCETFRKTMLKPLDKPPLTIRLCQPRGFCAGVDRAIQIVVLALKKYGAPVYVRHEIVHNRYVVEGLQKLGAVFIEELDEIPAEHRQCAGGLFRAWRAEIGAGRRAGPQSVLSRRDLPAGLQGAQAGDAPPAARPPCAADRPCRPSRSDRHDGAVAGRRGDADRDRGRCRGLRAGRSVRAGLRDADHAVGRGHGRHHPRARRSAFPSSRRRPPNRSATPPPTARKRSRKRRRAPISSWSSARPIRPIRGGSSRSPSAPAPECRFSCSAPSEIPWDEIGAISTPRPFGRRVGAGSHRRRDHRCVPRSATT